jgi:uncharacterized protein YgbK (DUF1537 family)
MAEADLREHLSRQTNLPIGLVDVSALEQGFDAARSQLAQVVDSGAKIVLFDTLTDQHLATIGKLLASVQEQEHKPLFVAGSSGVDYALTKHWRSTNAVAAPLDSTSVITAAKPIDRVLVISGSCSPVTGRQIRWAVENGFANFAINADATVNYSVEPMVETLQSGRSAIVHTCNGPDDPRFTTAKSESFNISAFLGRILRDVVGAGYVRRVAVFGGDTSGSVARSLGIDALEYAGSLEPGAPLCRVRSRHDVVNGLEIAFKGGQVGYDNFLNTVLRGRQNQ